ncbi:MAG TPA: hypothetical protein EYP33_04155 [Pyrodictium sp.]|nr:hypothetical protein [Pyrodictium sp.]
MRSVLHRLSQALSQGSRWLLNQLAAFIGLEHLLVDGKLPGRLGAAIVADTSLVYAGLHNEALLGARIVLPYCAILELTRRYAEHSKRYTDPATAVMDTLAYAALAELEAASVSLAPPQGYVRHSDTVHGPYTARRRYSGDTRHRRVQALEQPPRG